MPNSVGKKAPNNLEIHSQICHFANYLAELFAHYLAYRQPPLPRIAKFSGATLMNSFLTRTSRLISKILRISDKNTALESRTFLFLTRITAFANIEQTFYANSRAP